MLALNDVSFFYSLLWQCFRFTVKWSSFESNVCFFFLKNRWPDCWSEINLYFWMPLDWYLNPMRFTYIRRLFELKERKNHLFIGFYIYDDVSRLVFRIYLYKRFILASFNPFYVWSKVKRARDWKNTSEKSKKNTSEKNKKIIWKNEKSTKKMKEVRNKSWRKKKMERSLENLPTKKKCFKM